MARSSSKKKGGRIEVHDRNNVDDAKIIGEDIEIDDVHSHDIIETEQSSMDDKTHVEYMNRIARIHPRRSILDIMNKAHVSLMKMRRKRKSSFTIQTIVISYTLD